MLHKSLAGLALFALLGCDDKVPLSTPNSVVPNSSQVLGELRKAKISGENLAALAKRELRGRLLKQAIKRTYLDDGAVLYGEAEAAFNSAISRIVDQLGQSSDEVTRQAIQSDLEKGQDKYLAFQQWYEGSAKAESVKGMAASGLPFDFILDAAGIANDIFQQYAAVAAERRAEFRAELRKCEWNKWDEINALNRRR